MSSNEEKLINEYIVSFKNKDVIVETIISENKTELAIFTKKTRNIVIKDFYVVGNIRYLPIKLSSNLLSTGTLLLRKGIKPY
jgi:CTP:phosphocholine cytidylyltransferase-like protein